MLYFSLSSSELCEQVHTIAVLQAMNVEHSLPLRCVGEAMRFNQASQPAKVPKETAAMVTNDIMNRFAAEGFVYVGRVALADNWQQTPGQPVKTLVPTHKEFFGMVTAGASGSLASGALADSSEFAETQVTVGSAAKLQSMEAQQQAPPLASNKVPLLVSSPVMRATSSGNVYIQRT